MFIDPAINQRLALQRSATFAAMILDRKRFAPLERRESFGLPFYKHYVPTGLGSLEKLARKQEVDGLFQRERVGWTERSQA